MTLRDFINATCSSIRIVFHCGCSREIFINTTLMSCSTNVIESKIKDLDFYMEYQVLAISSYFNGVETVITVVI